jgi:predicted nucleic acid-binding protein
MKPVVYDTSVLIAADRGDRLIWAEHRLRLEAGIVPLVPSPVLAQSSRSPRQAQLRQLLRGCDVVPFEEADAHRVGALLGKAGTRDVVDAAVVTLAIQRSADIRTGDATDIRRLLGAARSKLDVLEG